MPGPVAAATGSINIVPTDSVKGWPVKEMLTLYVVPRAVDNEQNHQVLEEEASFPRGEAEFTYYS
jgi:hypothetical protein